MKKIIVFYSTLLFSLNVFSQAPNWQWAKCMGDTFADIGNSVTTDLSGNVYTIGHFSGTVDFDPGGGVTNLTAGNPDVFISKLNSSGNFVWAKSFIGVNSDNGFSIAVAPGSGNVYSIGSFVGTVDFDPGVGTFNMTAIPGVPQDVFVSKLDSSGNFIWAKQIGGSASDDGFSIVLDAFENLFITVRFGITADFDPGTGVFILTSVGSTDVGIVKLDSSGSFVWAKAVGGSNIDSGHSMVLDSTGSIYITGAFRGTSDFDPGSGVYNLISNNYYNVFILKLDNSGNFVWARTLGGVKEDYGLSVTVDVFGNVYTTGNFTDTADFDPGIGTFNLISSGLSDIFISKLDSAGNFIWAKQMGGTSADGGTFILTDRVSGDIYVTGTFMGVADFDPGAGLFNLTSPGGGVDIFIIKLSSLGNFMWVKSISGIYGEWGQAITFDIIGNLYVTGSFSSPSITFGATVLINHNSPDIFIAKLDGAVGMNEINSSHNEIILSPNPFHKTATLTINTNKIQEGTIEIKNILGATAQPPKHFTGNKIKLQRNNLPAGIYFYRITTKDGVSVNGKFIIN